MGVTSLHSLASPWICILNRVLRTSSFWHGPKMFLFDAHLCSIFRDRRTFDKRVQKIDTPNLSVLFSDLPWVKAGYRYGVKEPSATSLWYTMVSIVWPRAGGENAFCIQFCGIGDFGIEILVFFKRFRVQTEALLELYWELYTQNCIQGGRGLIILKS